MAIAAIAFILGSAYRQTATIADSPPPVVTDEKSMSSRVVDKGVSVGTPVTINKSVNKKISEKTKSETPFRFDVVAVFDALSKITVDNNGDVNVDHNTKELLEASFTQITLDLSQHEIEELQDLIRLGVPGKAGEQAAKVFADYYGYRVAETNFMDASSSYDIDNVVTNFEQIVAIRRAELGYDVAEKLFGLEEINTKYMIDSMKIESDNTLSREEKDAQQELLSGKYEERKASYRDKQPSQLKLTNQ